MENKILDERNPNIEKRYDKSFNRVKDIFIGLGIGLVYSIICALILYVGYSSNTILSIFLLLFYVAAIITFFKIKRKYISFGLLILLTILLFILGGCAILLSNLQIH